MVDDYSFDTIDDEPRSGTAAPVAAALGSRGARAAQLDIAQQRQALAERRNSVDETIKTHRDALDQAKGYYDLAANLTTMQTATEQKLDAADFLSGVSNISHTDPDYENKIATLAAKFPTAGNDPAVKEILGVKHQARGAYTESLQKGGAYEFEQDSPAFHKFNDIYGQTGDINQARAAAGNIHQGEQEVRKAKAAGFITDEDIYADPEKTTVKPELHDEQGYLHYNKLQDLAAQRAGEIGKPMKQEEAAINRDREFITKLAGRAEDLKDSDPTTFQLYRNAQNRILQYESKQAGGKEEDKKPAPSSASAYTNF